MIQDCVLRQAIERLGFRTGSRLTRRAYTIQSMFFEESSKGEWNC